MKVSLAQFTDRQLLEALAERVLLDDPSWVQERKTFLNILVCFFSFFF